MVGCQSSGGVKVKAQRLKLTSGHCGHSDGEGFLVRLLLAGRGLQIGRRHRDAGRNLWLLRRRQRWIREGLLLLGRRQSEHNLVQLLAFLLLANHRLFNGLKREITLKDILKTHKVSRKRTQLFFFISLLRVSSSLLLLPIEGKAELRAACTLDFLEGMEKSCTSLRSMATALEADLSISVMFILGKLQG